MRLVDVLFRQGHLSERALVDAVMTSDRPFHLDRCDICATRAVELNRWLDTVRTAATEAADEAFPQERLAAQQAQILRKLEQLDEPARVDRVSPSGTAGCARNRTLARRPGLGWRGRGRRTRCRGHRRPGNSPRWSHAGSCGRRPGAGHPDGIARTRTDDADERILAGPGGRRWFHPGVARCTERSHAANRRVRPAVNAPRVSASEGSWGQSPRIFTLE